MNDYQNRHAKVDVIDNILNLNDFDQKMIKVVKEEDTKHYDKTEHRRMSTMNKKTVRSEADLVVFFFVKAKKSFLDFLECMLGI